MPFTDSTGVDEGNKIIFASSGDVGTLICLWQGKIVPNALCPCCMLQSTREKIQDMIRRAKVTKVMWAGNNYGHAVPRYFPKLEKAGNETEKIIFEEFSVKEGV